MSVAPKLLVSVTGNDGDTGGGVFAVSEDNCELLDPVPTSGMALSPDRRRIARLTWVEDHPERSELLVSDQYGLLGYRRLDEVAEPHSLLWVGDELHAVSTGTNSVVVLGEDGVVRRTWRATGSGELGDRWHLNSLAAVEGRLVVCAFGAFATVRGWSEVGALDGAGMVLDLASRTTVLSGLSAPHDPTWIDGYWLVCKSGTGEVLRLDGQGQVVARIGLGGWTRGLLVDGNLAYVGVSAHRLADPVERLGCGCRSA